MNFKNSVVLNKSQLIQKFCHNKSVLDVGSIGQDIDFNNSNWRFLQIKKIARELLGVDINTEGVKQAQKKGYKIITPNELTEQQTFELVTMLDVIEHVDNIVDFINFYAKHMNSNSKLIISTPNPCNIRQFFSVLLFNKPSINTEHTTFIDPINFLEIAKRANLIVQDFYWLKEYTPFKKWYWKILNSIVFLPLARIRPHFNPNYVVVLTKNG